MKKTTLLLIAIALTNLLQAQAQISNNEQAVQQAVINMFDALSKRDSAKLKSHCAADITLYEYGQVWNIDTLILKTIKQNQSSDFKRTNSFEFINTTVDKTTAWVTYRLQSEITRDGKLVTVQWLETVVLINEKKQWKVKHLHSTQIRRS